MCGAARGEPIARAAASSNAWERAGARTLKGLPHAEPRFAGGPGGAKRTPSDTPGRRRASAARLTSAKREGGVRVRARARFPPEDPRRAKPKGATSSRRTNPAAAARDSRKGKSPETAAHWAGPALSATGAPVGETVRGFFRPETRRIPFGRRRLRRANPRSAAGVK